MRARPATVREAKARGFRVSTNTTFLSSDTPETVRAVVAKFRERHAIVSPRYKGKRGHPVVMPLALRDEIAATAPTANLHDVIHHHQNERVDLDVDDPGVVRDVDTPADLQR